MDSVHLYQCILAVLFAISIGLRLKSIDRPSHVCWDEAHVGRHVSHYLNRTFFMDVHPPLGKLILALVASQCGYQGEFAFTGPQDEYVDVKYVGMRMCAAVFGSLIVPLCAAVVWKLSHSPSAALLAGVFVISDTSLTITSRLILLDPLLMFFIILACFCYLKHHDYTELSITWWFWLVATGCAFTAAICVKFVGFFVVLLIGLSTVKHLLDRVYNPSLSLEVRVQLFCARVYALIFLPIALYCFMFAVHFIILIKSGPDDGFYSSALQSTLAGNHLHRAMMPEYLTFGATVTLRSHKTSGYYLHSYEMLNPSSEIFSQQVTTHFQIMNNNDWIIQRHIPSSKPQERAVYIRDGDQLQLKHKNTNGILVVGNITSPLAENLPVSCLVNSNTSDDHSFRLKVIYGYQVNNKIAPISTVFQLEHLSKKCVLESRKSGLTASSPNQHEVVCNMDRNSRNSLWNIETLDDVRMHKLRLDISYSKPGFLGKFVESHLVMLDQGYDLQADMDGFDSRPWMWPIVYKSQLISVDPHIIMLGNPVLHWFILLILIISFLTFIVEVIVNHSNQTALDDVYGKMGWLLLGWFLHYAPFWLMRRVLYTHHYLPALLFSCMYTGLFLDHFLKRFCMYFTGKAGDIIHIVVLIFIIAVLAASFQIFSPLVYGLETDLVEDIEHLMWLPSWDW